MYKFSVVIPTYQRPELLANTLNYLNMQDRYLDDLEVIVVDDGSKDDATRRLATSFPAKFDLHYLYLEKDEHSCRSRTRNEGAKAAKGEIVVFIDDDILVRSSFLAEHARYHEQYDHLLVLGYRRYLDQETTRSLGGLPLSWEELDNGSTHESRHGLFQKQSFNMNLFEDAWVHVYSVIMSIKRSNLVRSQILFDEDYKVWGVEDADFGYRLYKNGYKIVVNPELETYHQFHGEYHNVVLNYEMSQFLKTNDRIFQDKHGFSYIYRMRDVWREAVFRGSINEDVSHVKLYVLRDKANAETLKKELLYDMAVKSGKCLIIYDETDSSLDLWVQMLHGSSSNYPMYYPSSSPLSDVLEPLRHNEQVDRVIY
ncbi:glycosyltransferase family 2 protein [Paenibacillus kobensis]|uniref:glycosyltransferase family 2 protein n=1 Tax=Paenibacillus kobensis TaxID=59841 RepID=UPI0013E2FF55|nr:glycosyltransferase [Paenibacillus kobensis]